jgi:aldose 1-epimerase
MKKVLSMSLALLVSGAAFGEVSKKDLGKHNEKDVLLYTLKNKDGNILQVTSYGARIVRIEVPDKDGKLDNVTTGGDSLQTIVCGDAYGGATIGRFANRIANGKFTLDGKEYELAVNNRPNTLHGGRNGWHAKVWDSEIVEDSNAVKFTYTSPDMEEGFPGTVKVSVTYTWTDKNEIVIDYAASTDKKTVFNVTNHAYFNLHGAGKGYIFDHILTINAAKYTPLVSQIPTGKIDPVKDTPFDFTQPHPMGYKIGETFNGSAFQGYDDNYVLDNKKDVEVDATVYDPVSGRVMEVITDEPGMQFYSGSGGMLWKQAVDAGRKPESSRSSFALETQHFPDSPNHDNFPSTVLEPEKPYKSKTIYRFSVKKD